MMGDDAREAPLFHGLRQGGWVPGTTTMPSVSSSSSSSLLFSSTSSSLTDDDQVDDATSSPPGHRDVSSSSSSLTSSESSDKMHNDAAAIEGPLYELSTMLDHLPALRTGLSKFYRGRSQSFTSLAGVSCVEDLAKKTTPYIRRTKAPRCYAAALGAKNQLSKTIAKKARGTSLLHSSAKPPPANQGKREVYRC